jgi:D-3-phosphoglycerate dehydrogenase
MHDLLRFVAAEPRTYAKVMDAWRTSCPRLPVWEEATERGLLTRAKDDAGVPVVRITAAGRAFLAGSRA